MNTQTQGSYKSRPVKTLWAIIIIFVIGIIVGGVIVRFAFNSEIQDQLNSLVFKGHRAATTTPTAIPTSTPLKATGTPVK